MTDTDNRFTASHGTAFLQDMIGHGAGVLTRFADLPPDTAEQIAFHLADELIEHWGGSMLYIPKTSPSKARELHRRDLAIWQDFNGRNHHELGKKYDLSTVTIYQILAKVKKSLPNKQKDLFDE